MVQPKEVLTREEDHISLISTTRTAIQRDCLTVKEREVSIDTTEQTWIFGIGDKTPVGTTGPKSVNTLARIIRWLNRVGSGIIDDNCLEARHNIGHKSRSFQASPWCLPLSSADLFRERFRPLDF